MVFSIEILGTVSSVIVAVSLTQKNIKLLRILNFIGAAGFSIYGYYINSLPVLGLNSFIAFIDLYYYWTMIKYRTYFDQLEISKPDDSPYLKKFMNFYLDDIHLFQPSFNPELISDCFGLFVLRDMQPASVILLRNTEEGVLEMVLDYAVPAYRDNKSGEYFFKKALNSSWNKNIREINAFSESKKHSEYLKRLGFRLIKEESKVNQFKLII